MSTTPTTPAASGNTVAASLITVKTFSGQSSYSKDFQNIINKAVQVQEIPLSGLVDQVNSATKRQSALQTLDSDFTSLQSTITALGDSVGPQALAASVSNPSAASTLLSTGASAGTYQLQIDSLGSTTQTISNGSPQAVSNPNSANLSSSSSYTLTVNGTPYTIGTDPSSSIHLANNTLNSLVSAINNNSSTFGVTASIVNVGPSSAPDYRLAVQTTKLGAATVQISDGVTNLLQDPPIQSGSPAQYKVDGLAGTISSDSDIISLAPGLTVGLQQTTTPGNPITISVGQSTIGAGTALQSFVSAYNQTVTDLLAQHGQNGGALEGESVVLVAERALSNLSSYTSANGGALNGLPKLGLSLSTNGRLSFDATAFERGLGGDFTQLSQFIGDRTTGFLGAATNSMASVEDLSTGSIKTEEASIKKSLASLNTQITTQKNTINKFQDNLLQQLAISDAAISALQSQNSFFTSLFTTMNANNTA